MITDFIADPRPAPEFIAMLTRQRDHAREHGQHKRRIGAVGGDARDRAPLRNLDGSRSARAQNTHIWGDPAAWADDGYSPGTEVQIANRQGRQQRIVMICGPVPVPHLPDGHLPPQGLPSPGER